MKSTLISSGACLTIASGTALFVAFAPAAQGSQTLRHVCILASLVASAIGAATGAAHQPRFRSSLALVLANLVLVAISAHLMGLA